MSITDEMIATDQILQHLRPNPNLPPHLRAISERCEELAEYFAAVCPRTPERTTAFRKLLEAKDCAVRAALEGSDPQ